MRLINAFSRDHPPVASNTPDHHDHDSDHEITMSSELSERLGKIQLGAAAINAAVMLTRGAIAGIKEGVQAGFDSVNILSATDAGHNIVDWLKWKMEAAVDRHDLSPKTYKIFRGLTCAALAGSGAWSIADATLFHSDYNVYQGAASGVSAGAALYTGNVLRKGVADKYDDHDGMVDLWQNKMSGRDKDKAIHGGTDIFMAVGAAAGNLSGAAGNMIANSGVATGLGGIATALTVAGGAAAVGYFGIHTPFVKGLDKSDRCLVHDHATTSRSINATELLAQHSAEHHKKSRLEQVRSRGRHRREEGVSWWRRSIAIGAMAVAACFATGGETQEPPVSANVPVVVQPDVPSYSPTSPTPDIYAQQQTTVEPGDSQWFIASQKITEITGVTAPQERHIAEVTELMLQANKDIAPKPDLIHPGDILKAPSVGTIQMIVSR